MKVRALLFSNSTNFGSGYLDHAMAAMLDFLGSVRRLLFVPFALYDRSGYTKRAAARFARDGVTVEGLAPEPAGARSIREAEAVFVGGGNTFRLLNTLQRTGLLLELQQRAREGMPYMGASAGTNLAAPTIMTTNDMPIVQPASFESLGLVPFQINPHYLDATPDLPHMGETREQRIREFLEENNRPVVGLREGAWLRIENDEVRLRGANGARIFRRGADPTEAAPDTLLAGLL